MNVLTVDKLNAICVDNARKTFKIENITMQSSIFLLLFNNRNWTDDNGDSVIMNKNGVGYTTHGDEYYLPVKYYFDLINNGTVIVANNKLYSAMITQVDAQWSNHTKQLTLTFQVNKQHIHQKGWQEEQVPKSMPNNE